MKAKKKKNGNKKADKAKKRNHAAKPDSAR
jgi:hypothetical protein